MIGFGPRLIFNSKQRENLNLDNPVIMAESNIKYACNKYTWIFPVAPSWIVNLKLWDSSVLRLSKFSNRVCKLHESYETAYLKLKDVSQILSHVYFNYLTYFVWMYYFIQNWEISNNYLDNWMQSTSLTCSKDYFIFLNTDFSIYLWDIFS